MSISTRISNLSPTTILFFVVVLALSLVQGILHTPMATFTTEPDRQSYGELPLYFIQNQGQMDPTVNFYVQGQEKTIYFTSEGLTLRLRLPNEQETNNQNSLPDAANTAVSTEHWVVKLDFVNANLHVQPIGQGQTSAVISYFTGSAGQIQSGIPTYSGVLYANLWDGIDLVYSGTQNHLKYEFVVHPGADPNQIKLAYRGLDALTVNGSGELVATSPAGEFTDQKPLVYQMNGAERTVVASDYALFDPSGDGALSYGFELGDYDSTQELIIDPSLLVYAGFIGGSSGDYAKKVAVDNAGNSYVVGTTESDHNSFPVTVGPDLTQNGDFDAFVAKINPAGAGLVYAGYIGGSETDFGSSIYVDASGNAYITGGTESDENSFPVVVGPDLTYNGGQDIFIAKINPDGTTLLYAGYIGGSGLDEGSGIVTDAAGNAYISGSTTSDENTFPILVGPDLTYNGGGKDAVVMKVNPAGTGLVYAGYIGGAQIDHAVDLDLDNQGNAYLTGHTGSDENSFPVLAGPDLTYNGSSYDTFVAKVNSDGSGLVYAGYVGGANWDVAAAVAVDGNGQAYLTGWTASTEATFPVGVGPDLTHNGSNDAYVVKVNTSGSGLIYAGYIGGVGNDVAFDIALDGEYALIGGNTESDETTFPVMRGPDLTYNGGEDAFIAKIDPSGANLVLNGYIGGSGPESIFGLAIDSDGYIYAAGYTESDETTFPVLDGPDPTYNGVADAFIVKVQTAYNIYLPVVVR